VAEEPGGASSLAQAAAPPPSAASEPPRDNAWKNFRGTGGAAGGFGSSAGPLAAISSSSSAAWKADRRSFQMTWGEDDLVFGKGRRQFNIQGERLDKIPWNGIELIPVQKNFMIDHPNVAARTRDENDMIRLKAGIIVECEDGEEPPKPFACLEECSFPDWAADGLRRRSWKSPTPIQMQAWPAALTGRDVVAIASTGSGKTMAYVLPMLVHIMAQDELKPGEGPEGLVILPHRELCQQVARNLADWSQVTRLNCQSIFGGEDRERQKAGLQERVDVMVATPGRLIDLLNTKATNLRRATFVVLDEADDLLGQGFEDQINLLMSQIRPDRQVLLFSATWPETVERFAREICHQRPIHINIGGVKLAACKDVDQCFWCPGRVIGGRWNPGEKKIDALKRGMGMVFDKLQTNREKVLIFCNHIGEVPTVVKELQQEGMPCEGFTSDCTQAVRTELLRRFIEGDDLSILVCTQVLGRGHDFQNVKYVINYDMPNRLVDYVHRVGRTGRAGERGFSLTFLEETDLRFAKDICDMLRETGLKPEKWLEQESTRRKQKKWLQLYRDCRYGAPPPAITDATQESQEPQWDGRGRSRRHEFLHLCRSMGMGRLPGQESGAQAQPKAAPPFPTAVAASPCALGPPPPSSGDVQAARLWPPQGTPALGPPLARDAPPPQPKGAEMGGGGAPSLWTPPPAG
jgi:ATP-dependent RNA helicase DDX5/DBP2